MSKAQNSVLKREQMNVIEVPDKKIIAVNDENCVKSINTEENQEMVKEDENEMDISMNDDELPPNNQS